MAGKKTQAHLTPEEKLQQALVPEAEQPYKVPANWYWTYLKNVSDCLDNFRKPINANERNARLGDVPYYGATGQVGWIDDYLTNEELVLLGEDGAPFLDLLKNKAYLINGKAWVNNHAHILRSKFGTMGNRLLIEYLNSFDFTGFVTGTTRLKLTQASMNKIIIPLVPLAEQQRIVERIESLFAKLDEAKENLQNVLDGFETRKAAILHKAFTGELTAKWRKQHGVSMDSWEEKALGKIVKNIKDKYEPTLNNKKCVKYIGLEHIEKNNGIIGFGSSDDVKSLKTIFELGDILYGKLRPYLNKHDIAKFSGICSTDILVYRAEDFNTAKFINYFMNTEKFIFYTVSNSKGINLPRISEKEVSGILVNVPTLSEQSEIVRIIDDLLAKEQQAKELAENAITKIDIIKKSILARAFRGELGTNNPADEPAVELLKQVL